MFSVFEKNGVMDAKTGLCYRDLVLAKGSTDEEINLVKSFLGREPKQEAFFNSLGLQGFGGAHGPLRPNWCPVV